jgi:hypothetical protein
MAKLFPDGITQRFSQPRTSRCGPAKPLREDCLKGVSYEPPLMLTHEEWVNGGRYESLLARGRPTNPARDTNRPKRRYRSRTSSE